MASSPHDFLGRRLTRLATPRVWARLGVIITPPLDCPLGQGAEGTAMRIGTGKTRREPTGEKEEDVAIPLSTRGRWSGNAMLHRR